MKILAAALASALLTLPVNAQSSQWSIDPSSGIAHHIPSRGMCPAFLGGLPRTGEIPSKHVGDPATCTFDPPNQPDAQRISIQKVPDAPRARLDEFFRTSLLERFRGSRFVAETEAACQRALTEKMGTSDARCMAFERDGFTAFMGFHVIKGWSFQPMLVTSGKGLTAANIRLIGTTFGEIFTTEAQFMQLPAR